MVFLATVRIRDFNKLTFVQELVTLPLPTKISMVLKARMVIYIYIECHIVLR
jgi:hypothetical protein